MKSLVLGSLSAMVMLGALPLPGRTQVFSSQRASQSTSQTITTQTTTEQSATTQTAQTSVSAATLQTTLEQKETLYLDRKGTYDYDLVLRSASAINGQRLPVGTIVRGRFEPAEGGLVYRANSIELADRIVKIDAYSELFRDRKDPRETNTGAILTDAAIGAAGGYVLGEVLGDAGVIEVLGGAAAGVVIGNTTAPLVVVIRPEDPIVLYAQQ